MPQPDLSSLSSQILALAKNAGSTTVSIGASSTINLRFANNDITTNGVVDSTRISITTSFGKRSASVTVNQSDPTTLREAVARAESMAKLAPENPEHMPPPGPATFDAPINYSEATAKAGPAELAAWIRPVIEQSRDAKVNSAGYVSRNIHRSCLANSSGLTVFQESTAAGFSMTARTPTDSGSGWASTQVTDTAELDLVPVGKSAVQKALDSRNPSTLPPGRQTVVLEPAAARDLIAILAYALGRRSVDEKRSFLNQLSKQENPVGESLFGDKATLYSDPLNDAVPSNTHSGGLPLTRTPWIENGVLKNLHVGRFWAQKIGIDPLPGPANLIFPGDGHPLDDLIARIDNGVLVTRLWYIRMVQPQSLLYTGLTRDGTFRIENGKVTGPVKNFRFNESPVNLLRNLVASGQPARVVGSESSLPMLTPPLLVKDFNLSSISDAS